MPTYAAGMTYNVTIDTSGVYDIDAFGAQGGSFSASSGGFGAETGALFNLVAGERLRIVVGAMGTGDGNGGGGGGGSFVLASTDGGVNYTLLLASGGGGGFGGFSQNGGVGGDAHAVTDGSGLGNGGTGGTGTGSGGGGSGFLSGGTDGVGDFSGRGATDYMSSGAGGQYSGSGGYGGGGGGGNFGTGGGGGGYTGGNGGDGGNGSGGGAGTGGTSYISSDGTPVSTQVAAAHTGNGSVTVTFKSLLAAPTGSYPSTGKAVTFDGSTDVTAQKGDLLVLTLDPQNFAGGAEQNGNVVLSANGHTATILNAFLTSDGIPNTFLPQGDFLIGRDGYSITSTKANSIMIGLPGSEYISDVVDPSLAAGSHVIFGGVGRVDTTDGADTITFGGKGLWSVFANAGADQVTQDGAATSGFDSASVVNVYGQEGNDAVTLINQANLKASIFVGGGAGLDTISVVNAGGATTIFGGDDSTDGADVIAFNAAGTAGSGNVGAGGTVNIFGNGGDDRIFVGSDTAGVAANGVGLDSTSTSNVFGGYGNDSISIRGVKAAITVIGGEGSDTITVQNTGTTYITGGNPSGGDQSLDGADSITVNDSGGTIAIFGNLGNDSISAQSLADSTTIQIYGGKDNDTIFQTNLNNGGKNSIFIAGGEGSDTIQATGNGGALTVYGGVSSSDSADGGDQINLSINSTGTINIFANGGNDTVSIAQLGADTANTATVYGGGGADSINIGYQGTGSETLVVSGNEGGDTFAIAKGAGQTITVADFKASEGDTLKLTALGGTPGSLQVAAGTFQTLQQALDAAANQANATTAGQAKVAAIAFAGSTYVVIDNTVNGPTGGFAATDQAIKLTGVTDLVGLAGATTLSA